MNKRKLIIGGLFLFLNLALFGQNKALQKANALYKAAHYAEAAELYEIALQKKSNLFIKTKLANCYRMNNRLDKAETLYAAIVTEDKARSETYFYYGEVLMGNEKYDEAKQWFLKYHQLEPEEERGKSMAEVCDKVKTIKPFFPYLRVEEFTQNSEADDATPVFWGNGIVFSSDRKIGLKLMKEKSGWTGRDYLNLYYSEKEEDAFGEAKLFSIKLNELNKNTGNPSFLRDGSRIFFTRNDFETSRNGTYNMQLFSAESVGGTRWKTPKKLKFCSSEFNYMHPAVSPDGQWLVFVSDKKGSLGGTDLWMVEKKDDGWGKPQNLSDVINTPSHEGFPFIDEEGKLFFCSKGHVGYGGFDIFMTRKNAEGIWQKPINLGRPINSPRDDISIALDGEKRRGLFTSNRIGGDDDIFLFQTVDRKEEAGFFVQERPSVLLKDQQEEVLEAEPVEMPVEKVKIKNKDKNTSSNGQESPDLSLQSNASGSNSIEKSTKIDVQQWETPKPKPFLEITKLLANNQLEIGQTFRLDGAVYDYQVFQVTTKVVASLDGVVDLLKENPNLKIELGAHTDSYGAKDANLTLSRNRAVYAGIYLYGKGISSQQLVTKGYGERALLNHCADDVECSMEEHLENQRLEIKVLAF